MPCRRRFQAAAVVLVLEVVAAAVAAALVVVVVVVEIALAVETRSSATTFPLSTCASLQSRSMLACSPIQLLFSQAKRN